VDTPHPGRLVWPGCHRLLARYSGDRLRLWHPGDRPWRTGTTECGHACRVPSDGCRCRGSGPHRRSGAGRDGGGSLERRGAALSRSRGSGPMTEGVVRWTSGHKQSRVEEATWPTLMKTGSRSQPPATVDCDSRCLAHLAGLNSVAWGTLSRPRSSRIRPANQMDTSRNDRNLLAAQRPDSEATVRRVVVASLSRRFRAFSTPLTSPSTRCWSDPRRWD
jgi:hypothetical protein